MKQKKTLAWTAFALCLCTSWIASGSFADSKNPAGDKAKSHVKIVDGQKVLVPADETKASPKPVGRLARPEYQEYLRKLESRLSNQPSAPSDDDAGGDPRGDPEGACCDPSSGVCSIRTQQACTNVGGNYLGNGTTCLPVNPCPQPIDCNLGPDNPVNQFTLFPPDPDFDPFATFLSDVDAGQIAAQGYFSGAAGEVRVVRWWGVELSGAANCNRTNNNFDITFFADADLLGNSPTVPTPEIVAQFPNVTAVRLKAKSFTFEDPGQESYGGSLLWEYTVTLPQRVAMYSGWVAIQATADGTPCNFRWMCSDFGPGWLEHNGQPVEDPDIHDASICVSGTGATVSGACCDDSVQGGSCTNNVQASQCHDFDGGDHRFRPDITCAQVTPACGSITGSCCVGATCTVVTGAQCETAGGSFIAFEDCDTNPCVGACCLGDGGCVEILENDCLGQTGQFFGDGTLCSQTACPGTGRCCSNAGQTCTISTEPACDAIAGSRWDEGLNCATPCPIPPTNDECANALAITCGQTITVDVTEATTGGDDPDFPCSGGGVNSVWFTFVPTASSATIRTCASLPPANDSIIQIFDGTCGAFGAPLMCGEDECGLLSTICVPNLIIGNTYYIQLSAFSAFSLGAYSLEIVCPGETCQSTGSCCLSSGGCVVVSEPACGDQGGVYNGDSTICEEVGACCTGVGDACLPSTEQCCTAAGFTFLGAGTTCGSALGEPQEFSASPNTAIPDANAAGVSSTISVADAFSVGDVDVKLNITHTWVGDLCIVLEHNGTSVPLVQRMGAAEPDPCHFGPPFGCFFENFVDVILDDSASAPIEDQCVAGLTSPPNFTPFSPLAAFNGSASNGDWTLTVSDNGGGDLGTLNAWSVIIDGLGISSCDPDPGACCFSEGIGDCQQLNAIDCATAGGIYKGGGTPCVGDICVPRGACCDNVTGGCDQLTEEACLNLPTGNFLGDLTNCADCPIILGSCCNADGSCTSDITFDPCVDGGGSFTPEGTCEITGACCFSDESCLITTSACCTFGGGEYLGNDTNCGTAAGNPVEFSDSPNLAIPDGVSAGVETSITVADSFIVGDVNVRLDVTHTFVGDLCFTLSHGGTEVIVLERPGAAVECSSIADAGCFEDNYVDIILDDDGEGGPIETQCVLNLTSPPSYTPNNPLSAFVGADSAGEWTLRAVDGFGIDAGTLNSWSVILDEVGFNPCDPEPGACCFSEGLGDCQVITGVLCFQQGGRFQGGGSACTGNICVPRGACCDEFDGSCDQLTQEECEALENGNFLGDFTGCGQCPIILGACCLPDTTCMSDVQFNECEGVSGAFLPGSSCGEGSGNPTPYTNSPAIPFGDAAPTITDTINVPDSFIVGDVNVGLDIQHTWVGDFVVEIEHNGTSVRILDRPGLPANPPFGCDADNYSNILIDDDGTGGALEDACVTNLTSPPSYTPLNPLNVFTGTQASGDWTITITDLFIGADDGTLNSWTVELDPILANPCDSTPGACCFSQTLADCQILDAITCATQGGRPQGGGTACVGDICLIRGACCDPFDGSCEQLPEATCTGQGGNWLGGFTSCAQCPIILGACCLTGTECEDGIQFNACDTQGGTFLPNQDCGEAAGNPVTFSDSPNMTIPDPVGAPTPVSTVINVPDNFILGDVDVTLSMTHTFVGDICVTLEHNGTSVQIIDRMGSDTGSPCHLGAPFGCFEDNFSGVVLDDEGTVDIEAACALNLTSPPNYRPNNPLSAFDGESSAGDWTLTIVDQAPPDPGVLTSWSISLDEPGVNPCDTEPGACCFSETLADCQILSAVACVTQGGRPQGGGTACAGDICVIRGACCDPLTSACEQLPESTCEAQGDNWLGGFTSCGGCPVILGACCLPDETCVSDAQYNTCIAQSGTFIPNSGCGDANPATPIPDLGTITSTITVGQSLVVNDVNVVLDITHTYMGDLCITLEHNGTSVQIIDRMGEDTGVPCHLGAPFGCFEDNFNDTVLDDEGTEPIEAACVAGGGFTAPPNYTPNNSLSAFDGADAAGDWTLTIQDRGAGDIGTLNAWNLVFDPPLPSPCDVAQGACCMTDESCLVDQTEEECDAVSGVWQGGGTSCDASGDPTPYTAAPNVNIPNNNLTGITNTITVPDSFAVADVDIGVVITHAWVGDLIIRVTHNGVTRELVNRVGFTGTGFGCPQDNFNIRLDDEGTAPIETGCTGAGATPFPTSPPNFTANESLDAFDGMDSVGTWVITVIDALGGTETGTAASRKLVSWTVHIDGFGGGACSATGECTTCLGDVNNDNALNGKDVEPFTDCVLAGSTCPCGDMNNDGVATTADTAAFVGALLTGTGPCGSVPICTTCMGDGNGDDVVNGRDAAAFVTCLLSTPGTCPCADMNGSGTVENADLAAYVTALLQTTGPCP